VEPGLVTAVRALIVPVLSTSCGAGNEKLTAEITGQRWKGPCPAGEQQSTAMLPVT